ncbi:MAG: glycosyltransferase [Thermomicrobiales bacterium]
MRIALISEHASPAALLGGEDAGGQNVYVDEISRCLGRFGFEVDIFTRRDNVDAPHVDDWAPGVRIINLPAGPAQFVRKDDLWPLMPSFRDELIRFAIRDGVRYELVHGNFWMSGWVTTELRRIFRIPAVQLFHALGATKRRQQGAADTSPQDRIAVERAIVRSVDRVIATCPSERQELIEDYDAPPSCLETIPHGVDADVFRPVDHREARHRIDCGLSEDDLVLVYVGRLLPRKDVRSVVRALALLGASDNGLPPVKLLVVGGESRLPDPAITPEIGEVRQLAEELGVADRVLLTGKRDREELCDYYCAGDVMVTTPWYEPFGLTPLEAMACGRPVVGSNVGGISYTVCHGETGLLVPSRSPEALAAGLHALLSSPVRRKRMGAAGRRRVEREFTWRTVAEKTATLYEAVRWGEILPAAKVATS